MILSQDKLVYGRGNKNIYKNDRERLFELTLNLTAEFIRFKKKTNQKEKIFIYRFYKENYGYRNRNVIDKRLHLLVINKFSVFEYSKFEISHKNRLQALFFAINLCAVDGLIDFEEQKFLEKCRINLDINKEMYETVKRKYFSNRFEQEKTYNYNSGYKRVVRLPNVNRAYGVLGISPQASISEIKKAYRNFAKKYHPDKHTSKGENIMRQAEGKFREITEAYQVIKKKRGIV